MNQVATGGNFKRITDWLQECVNSSEDNNNECIRERSVSISGTELSDSNSSINTGDLTKAVSKLTFANVRQLCPDDVQDSVSDDDGDDDNVSVVRIRQNKTAYGHLPILEQFRRIGSEAISLQRSPQKKYLRDMTQTIERNFPHGIRSTTIAKCLTNDKEDILPNSLKIKLAENYTPELLIDLLSRCTE